MLLKLREKTSGWIAGIIVGILIIPFAFFGVTDYFTAPTETWVAKVGDSEISQEQFQRRFEEYRQQMRQMLGERYDGRQIERADTKKALLERLVDEELLRQSASSSGAIVPPERLQEEIASIPAFQVGGAFNVDQYRLLLSSQNMSPREFEQRIARDLEVRILPQGIEASAFATGADVDRYIALRDQKRDLRYLLIEPPSDPAEAPEEAALQAFYEANGQRYLTEEQVAIEYIELRADALEVPTVADEDSLRRRYEEQRSRFVEPEQRLASHILVKTAADADADAQKAAQAKAQAIAEQARAEGADFAALAREQSEDAGSRNGGGDLGWLERGFTDPAFESGLFALEAGTISDPVKSSEGWHVIQLREVRPEKGKSFEDVRAELEREFLETERERRYSDLAGLMVDALYRDPTSLATAAREVGLEIRSLAPFGRVGGEDPLSSDPKVLAAAFSPAVLLERTVSEALEVADGRLVALRVVDHKVPAPIPLAEIREQVAQEYAASRRAEAAKVRADALKARLLGGEPLDALASELGVEVQVAADVGRDGVSVAAEISEAAFELAHPTAGGSSRTLVALGGDRHALVEVTGVRAGDASSLDAAMRDALRGQLAELHGSVEAQAYVAALRTRIPVRLALERL